MKKSQKKLKKGVDVGVHLCYTKHVLKREDRKGR